MVKNNPYKMPRLKHDGERWLSGDPLNGGVLESKGEFLSFQSGNAKLKNLRTAVAENLSCSESDVKLLTLTLPAGFACPGANECLSFADPTTGKVFDGPENQFRCFEASAERYLAVRLQNWHNFNFSK